jgi:4a-hydroxytetrahydrobiopterin dehydratase
MEALTMKTSKKTLSKEELGQLIHELPEWAVEGGQLVRFWAFPDFVHAIAFVNRVAEIAENAGHHPDIDIRYNRVKLALVSHDAGGITARDAQMARELGSTAVAKKAPAKKAN